MADPKQNAYNQADMVSRDAWSEATGELALAQSPVFCAYGLRLYCGLTVNDGETVDYLVCTPKAALLGIRLTVTDSSSITPAAKEGHVPIANFPRFRMKGGTVRYLETEIYRILAQDAAQPTLSACQIPEELHPKLADMRMIRHPDSSQLWEPTSYGASLGVFRGYLGGEDVQHTLFILNEDVLDRLQGTLDRKLCPADRWDEVPWEQRMKKLSQGRACNSAYAAAAVRTLADTPLSGLLAQYPDELESLSELLPGPLNTFQDAAFQIGRLMHGSKQEKAQAEMLAFVLTKPLMRKAVNVCPLQEDAGASHPGTSWADRLARSGEGGHSLLSVVHESFPTILEGAAILSGQPYLLWLIEEILNEEEILAGNRALLQNSFQHMLRGAKTQIDSKSPETSALGRKLLLKLAIEPFYLMRLSENSVNHST